MLLRFIQTRSYTLKQIMEFSKPIPKDITSCCQFKCKENCEVKLNHLTNDYQKAICQLNHLTNDYHKAICQLNSLKISNHFNQLLNHK